MDDRARAWADGSDAAGPEPGPDESLPSEAAAKALCGTVLDRRYAIEALLGRGGMGTVYRAEQLFLRLKVALKILHPVFTTQPEFVERFRREAEIAVRLRSRHVAQVLDCGRSEDGRLYLAMELLAGESMTALIRRERRLAPERARPLLRQLLTGLRDVHAAGIVHRDLKPDNLWLSPGADGEPVLRILDFGIAKLAQPAPGAPRTRLGLVMGTPEYLAPEQALGHAVDRRADLYGFGIIAYVLLTGRHPFNTSDPRALLAAHALTPVPPITDARPELAAQPELVELVARATAKAPDERAGSADELIDLLDGFDSEAPTRITTRVSIESRIHEQHPTDREAPGPAAPPAGSETLVALRAESRELGRLASRVLGAIGNRATEVLLASALLVLRLVRVLFRAGERLHAGLTDTRARERVASILGRARVGWRRSSSSRPTRAIAVAALIATATTVALVALRADTPHARASQALETGHAGLALVALGEADEDDARSHALRGRALAGMNRDAEAIEAFREAAKVAPESIAEAKVIEVLARLLRGAQWKGAVDLLVEAGPGAVDVLSEASKDAKSHRRRWGAIEALRRLGREDRADLVAAYVADLATGDCDLTVRAARRLGELGDRRAVEPLRVAADRRDLVFESCEAEAARAALQRLGVKPADTR